jgi:hypothetical protein
MSPIMASICRLLQVMLKGSIRSFLRLEPPRQFLVAVGADLVVDVPEDLRGLLEPDGFLEEFAELEPHLADPEDVLLVLVGGDDLDEDLEAGR